MYDDFRVETDTEVQILFMVAMLLPPLEKSVDGVWQISNESLGYYQLLA